MTTWYRRVLCELRRLQPAIVAILGIAATIASLAFVAAALHQQGLAPLLSLATSGLGFWAAFAACMLVEPLALCWMMHRLLGTGAETLPPLLRKQALNTLLFGYAGDTLFLAWLERHIGNARAAFALVFDVAILSALVNNVATLALLFVMRDRLQALAGAKLDDEIVLLAIAFAAIPLVMIGWRRQMMRSAGIATIMTALGFRTVAYSLLVALTWHFAMPEVPLRSLLLLTTARMVVCRLPIIPNKDLAFAGCVALFLGPDEKIAAVISGVALLTLVAELALLLLAQLPARVSTATAPRPLARAR
ncbi:hypothetical protein AB5I39_14700 [Sphingomonas sp. MMS24-J45]|uniref:hypothetical protein n=1 Tax=Sphingomonas sp. MMS24-J45 TaxID=3238806 RepID=UPI00384AAD87